jgi:hypothetical protein
MGTDKQVDTTITARVSVKNLSLWLTIKDY